MKDKLLSIYVVGSLLTIGGSAKVLFCCFDFFVNALITTNDLYFEER